MPESDADKLIQRNRELSILNAIAGALNRSVDLDAALRAALAQTASLLGLQAGWIWLLPEETGVPYLAAAQHLPPALAERPERMQGSCYCLDCFQAGEMEGAANINVITCSRLKGIVDGTDGLRCHASIPLHAQEKRLGVLNVAAADWRELSPDDLRLLHTMGDLLGMAIERARLFAAAGRLGAAEERNRLAREIHDGLAQGLAGVALRIETADALMEAGAEPARVREALGQALALTRASLEDARRSVLDLRAAPLDGQGLAGALAALVAGSEGRRARGDGRGRRGDGVRGRGGEEAKIVLSVIGEVVGLPPRVEAGLYRVAQEALGNAVRHAGAREIRVTLEVAAEEVRLRVEDDGRGFDPAAVAGERFGLVGLSERVRLLGGRLRLESAPGAGTSVAVAVPREERS